MSRRIAIVAALLLQLVGGSLAAQQPRQAQKDLLEALTLLRRGIAEVDLGNVDRARSILTDAAKKMRAQNDALGTWMAHMALSHVENAAGWPKEAIAQIETALAVIDDASRSGAPVSLEALLAVSGLPRETIDSIESNSVEPLRSKIRQKRLMIIPHSDLHYVPFAALYDEKSKRYLVEDYPITYIPSASTIQFLREKDSPVSGTALVLGDPVAGNLPGAAREARKVAEKLHTTAKLGEEAKESLLYDLHGKVDLVHIAAHGTYDATTPLFSAIHLAPGNGRNGQLNVDEIQSELDLSGVNLVVLAACQSGVGQRNGGDEIIGLTRSILYAGSPGVIATLWNISDDATPPLIEKFYDHLLAGATAADALRAAQMDLLRDPNLADPRFWAAFFLTGDPQGNWERPSS